MKPADRQLAQQIKNHLISFDRDTLSLPGLAPAGHLDCFVEQIVDSVRRIKYIEIIRNKPISSIFLDATTSYFDPIKGACWHKQQGNIEDAFWMVFLATHFGKNKTTGWGLARGTYGALGHPAYWDWTTTSSNPNDFRNWLAQNQGDLKDLGNFSNHRKYQSLDATSPNGTGAAFESYITWTGGSHQALFDEIKRDVGDNPKELFDAIYKSMNSVVSFGRMGRFDYLTMVGKLGLLDIEPKSTYMTGATGPKSGAQLLFAGNINTPVSNDRLNDNLELLELQLNLPFGMQVLEDALCNWQKNPTNYTHFNG